MKIALLIAGILLAVGLILGVIGLAFHGFNFKEISMMKSIENSYVVSESFSHIAIESSIGNVEILPATDGVCRVDCKEKEQLYFTVNVANDTLCITLIKNAKWYHFIGVNGAHTSATVYLPEGVYASLDIKNTTGNVTISTKSTFDNVTMKSSTGSTTIENVTVNNALSLESSTGSRHLINVNVGGNLTMQTTTGSLSLKDVNVGGTVKIKKSTGGTNMNSVTCESLHLTYASGGATLANVVASGHMEIEGSTGSLRFECADAASIKIKTSTGSIKGTLRTEKIFLASSSSGSINVPHSTSGGVCEIQTSTGSIHLELAK